MMAFGLGLLACEDVNDAAGAREPGTPPASVTSLVTPVPAPVRDCGTEVLRQDARPVDEAARDCVRQAFTAGTRAVFAVTRPTVEGDPVTTRVEVLGAGRLRVSVDRRADRFSVASDGRVQTFDCTSLGTFTTEDGTRLLEVSGCPSANTRLQI